MLRREGDEEIAVQDAGSRRQHDQATIGQLDKGLNGALDICGVLDGARTSSIDNDFTTA